MCNESKLLEDGKKFPKAPCELTSEVIEKALRDHMGQNYSLRLYEYVREMKVDENSVFKKYRYNIGFENNHFPGVSKPMQVAITVFEDGAVTINF